MGCGYAKAYAGKSERKHPTRKVDGKPELLTTCPHFYARSEFVRSVDHYYADYERGATGPVWDLPNVLFECLAALEGERSELKAALEKEIYKE